ncbi:histone-like nucleoid-structuring protein Lsr2 [Microbacterium sp. KR10-403]|uniref:Lsr2 dimerization domain-containing protein n=1 Tax=Microbacterium sp. KR10-403 TaxID=3158581 RepID=UPI0032E3ACAD
MAFERTMIDDLDGTAVAPGEGDTVEFVFRGQAYALELSSRNEEKLAQALAPFIAVARKTDVVPTPVKGPAVSYSTLATNELKTMVADRPYELRDARRWLAANGHDVSKRGPIQEHFLKIFEEANGFSS